MKLFKNYLNSFTKIVYGKYGTKYMSKEKII